MLCCKSEIIVFIYLYNRVCVIYFLFLIFFIKIVLNDMGNSMKSFCCENWIFILFFFFLMRDGFFCLFWYFVDKILSFFRLIESRIFFSGLYNGFGI